MVVRDLLVMFGAQLDPKSMKNVENKAKGTAGLIQTLFSSAFVFGVGKGILAINELASDVEENMNVINQSFGDSAGAVTDWAQSFGDAAGRNRYEMEQSAAMMGAVLNPLMEKNTEVAADMSMGMAQLAVDLGSFYNTADSQALAALRSGLTGEAEAMKKFGIVMNDTTLEAFRLDQGVNKSVKAMSIAEKTALRYKFILDQTASAQGDAVRTAEGWANAKKGLIAKLKEMATTAGLRVLPMMSSMVNFGRRLVSGFNELTKGTHFFESALITLGVVAAAVAVKLLIAFSPILIPMLKLAAIFAIVVLVVEDFYTFLKGGDSLLGRFIDSVWGPGSAAEALDYLKLAFEALVFFWENAMLPVLKDLWEGFKLLIGFIAEVAVDSVKFMIKGFQQIWDFLGNFFGWLGDELERSAKLIDKFLSLFDRAQGKVGALRKSSDPKISAAAQGRGSASSRAAASFGANVPRSSVSNTSGPTTINNTTQVAIDSATPQTADTLAKRVTDSNEKMLRRTAAALTQRVGG